MKRDRTPDDEEEDDLPHAEEEEDEALEDEEEADGGDADADPGDAGDDDGGDLDLDAELERELAAGEAEAQAEEVKAGDRPASPTPREATAEEPGDPGRAEPTPAPAARTASPEDAAAADAEAASRAAWAARTRALAAAMTEEQMDRYEAFRRATLARPAVKKLIHATSGSTPNSSTVIVVAGVAKVFVAELVEAALEEAAKLGQTGPLRPAHVAAAFQRLEAEGRGLPCTAHPRRRVRL